MANGVAVEVEKASSGLRLRVKVDEVGLAGKVATFKVEQRVEVKRSSPVHQTRTLATRTFNLRPGLQEFDLEELPRDCISYSGHQIDIEINGKLEIDDGILFDTKIDLSLCHHAPLPPREKAPTEHKSVHSPSDRFNFIANLRAIPAKARLIVIWLMLVGIPVVVGNALLGVRDEMVPESQTWFYDHSGSDGSESPIVKALMGSGGVGFALWMAIRRQLQKYMDFSAKLPPADALRRDGRVSPRDMISGKAQVALEQAVVRVVAYNREHGQYTKTEKSGNSTRTVTKSFVSPAGGVVLYEQLLPHIPANMPLQDFLAGEIAFEPLFDALYPPVMVGSEHGLSVQLEAQLLHPVFVDHDIEMPLEQLNLQEFYGRG